MALAEAVAAAAAGDSSIRCEVLDCLEITSGQLVSRLARVIHGLRSAAIGNMVIGRTEPPQLTHAGVALEAVMAHPTLQSLSITCCMHIAGGVNGTWC